MLMLVFVVVLSTLTTLAIKRIWFEGSLFKPYLSRLELYDRFFNNLMTCPLCLGHWIGLIVVVVNIIDYHYFPLLSPDRPTWFVVPLLGLRIWGISLAVSGTAYVLYTYRSK